LTIVFARPRLVASTVVFCVLFTYFTANAIYAQYRHHPRALFSTRELAFDPDAVRSGAPAAARKKSARETRIVIDRSPVRKPPQGDKTVARVQKALSQMGLYHGAVDGLKGPMTSDAIRNYQKIVGLAQTGEVDTALLGELNQAPAIVSAIPTPRPKREAGAEPDAGHDVEDAAAPEPENAGRLSAAEVDSVEAVVATAGNAGEKIAADTAQDQAAETADAGRVARIQAGLRAFGHDAIEIDGVAAGATIEAIREFQRLFRLEPTGLADEAVEAKMREIGLIN
jgi:peptidoglycan hydrolase-like protein with peptidoglycan-binding domain